ncbi:hypothetical protein [Reyranella sp.]|nr:hypothetical protein [Reyranella sp.]
MSGDGPHLTRTPIDRHLALRRLPHGGEQDEQDEEKDQLHFSTKS